jgi:hypothetical protein
MNSKFALRKILMLIKRSHLSMAMIGEDLSIQVSGNALEGYAAMRLGNNSAAFRSV